MNLNIKYLFEWSEPYYTSDAKVITEAGEFKVFVCEDNGFDEEAVNEISNLEINQVWEFQGMRVKRVQGSYVVTDDEFIINEDLADKVAQEVLLGSNL